MVDDSLIGEQKNYIRDYVPLVKFLDGINGMPVTKEFRFFIAFGQVISGGYYWQNYIDDLNFVPDFNEVPKEFLQKVIDVIGDKSNFYVVDVGQKQDGDWTVIELNDGTHSGLSCNDPDILYGSLKKAIDEKYESSQ